MIRNLVTILLLASAPLAAQQRDLTPIADTVFARWNSTHSPGCVVGVAREGQVLFTRGYGMADLETGAPITPQTIFESGSVAKQFTATAVMLLVLDGKLKLDDPVRKYFPEMPEYDRPITIRHLLTHTSGLREWSSLVGAAGWPRGERAHTQADLLNVVFRQKSLNYPVGDYYSYTNSGYAIAMSLVEKVSGKTYQQFFKERIFGPLGMTHTQWRDDFTRIVPGRAQAYSRQGGEWHLEMPFENVIGPGGLLTTVGDWLIWNEALAKSKLAAGLTDSLTRRMRLTSGRQIQYALGLVVGDYRGVPEVQHSGSTAGYSTFLARYPDRGNLSVAVLCNAAGAPATLHVHQLVDRLVTDFPRATLDTTRADVALFGQSFGWYRNERTRQLQRITPEFVSGLRALPQGWYWRNNARYLFRADANGKPQTILVAQADGDTARYVFVGEKSWTPTREELRQFEGSYRSEEIDATYQVKLNATGDSLTVSARPGIVRTLQPVVADAFEGPGALVWFTRERGRVTAMHLTESRLWDLVLPRVR